MPLGAILGLAGIIGKGALALKQNSLANKIHPEWNQYQVSQSAKDNLGITKQLFGGRMAGAAQAENNIQSAQTNAIAGIGRNATDSASQLALLAGTQGTANQGYGNLQSQEAGQKYNLLNNLTQAYQQMTAEGDKVYNSQLQKYQQDVADKAALRNSAINNGFGALSDLGGFGMMGGFKNLLGGGGSGGGGSKFSPAENVFKQSSIGGTNGLAGIGFNGNPTTLNIPANYGGVGSLNYGGGGNPLMIQGFANSTLPYNNPYKK